MSHVRPSQKVPFSEKNPDTDKGQDFIKKTLEYYKENAQYAVRNEEIENYRLASGEADTTEYHYLTNPLNTDNENLQNFPSKLQNYPIIPTILNLLMGEKTKRPRSVHAKVLNPDSVNKKKIEEGKTLSKILEQLYVNQLNEQGVDTGMPSKDVGDVDQNMKKFAKEWSDHRADMGQHALNIIDEDLDMPRKFRENFYHWLVTGKVFSYRDVFEGDVYYEPMAPIDISYVAGPDIEFIENAEAVISWTLMTRSQIIEKFYDLLKDYQIDQLENGNFGQGSSNYPYHWQYTESRHVGEFDYMMDSYYNVCHITWKSFRKVGVVTHTDILGNEEEFEVDENYKPDENEEVEWYWVPEVWEAYELADSFITGAQPLPIQRHSKNNLGEVKLPYNGRVHASKYSPIVSVVDKLKPYQHLYNVIKYKSLLALAKDHGQFTPIPSSLIPDREGWDYFRLMYYAMSTGYMPVEGDRESLQALQYMKSIDMSTVQYVQYVQNYLQQILLAAEESVGITRQRKGNVTPSDGKGTTEAAINQSATISETLFLDVEEFEEKDWQCLLDYSKFAWQEGKKGTYINSDKRVIYYELNPEDYQNADFGVYAVNAAEEREKLNIMRQNAQSFAQNQMRPSMIGKMLQYNNLSQLVDKLEEEEEEMQKMRQQSEESQQKMEKYKTDREYEMKEKELEQKYYEVDKEAFVDLKEAAMQNHYNMMKLSEDSQNLGEQQKKSIEDTLLKMKEMNAKIKDMEEQRKLKKRELDIEEKKAKADTIKAKEYRSRDD